MARLKAVPDDGFMSVSEALAHGSRRDVLLASARRLTGLIDDPATAAKDVSPLMRRLSETHAELEALDAAEERERAESAESARIRADEKWDADVI